MITQSHRRKFARIILSAAVAAVVGTIPAVAQNGCSTGAPALAEAYVLANPIYSMILGDLRSYVIENRELFVENGAAIRCGRVVSSALLRSSIQSYDPDALRRRDALNTQLQTLGLGVGQQQPTPSEAFFAMGQQISRLVEVLPRAARGGPLEGYLPPEQAFAADMMKLLLQDPMMRAVFFDPRIERLIREAVRAEFELLLSIAENLDQ